MAKEVVTTTYDNPYCEAVGSGSTAFFAIPGFMLNAIIPAVHADIEAWVDSSLNLKLKITGWWWVRDSWLNLSYRANTGHMFASKGPFHVWADAGAYAQSDSGQYVWELGTWTIVHSEAPSSYNYWETFWDGDPTFTLGPITDFIPEGSDHGYLYIGSIVDIGPVTSPVTVYSVRVQLPHLKRLLDYFPASVRNASGEFRSCNRPYKQNVESAGFVQRWDGSTWIERKNRSGSIQGSTVFLYTSPTQYTEAPKVGGGGN